MIVEKIEVKNKRTTINDIYDIHTDVLLELSFDIGDDIDIEKVKFISDKKDALEKSMRYAVYKMRTTKEVEKKLQDLGYSNEIIAFVIPILIDNYILDDYKYVRMYIESKKYKNGSLYIKKKLREKGVSDYILREIEIDEDMEVIKNILISKYGEVKDVTYNEKNKMIRFLNGRGFLLKNAINAVENYISNK